MTSSEQWALILMHEKHICLTTGCVFVGQFFRMSLSTTMFISANNFEWSTKVKENEGNIGFNLWQVKSKAVVGSSGREWGGVGGNWTLVFMNRSPNKCSHFPHIKPRYDRTWGFCKPALCLQTYSQTWHAGNGQQHFVQQWLLSGNCVEYLWSQSGLASRCPLARGTQPSASPVAGLRKGKVLKQGGHRIAAAIWTYQKNEHY